MASVSIPQGYLIQPSRHLEYKYQPLNQLRNEIRLLKLDLNTTDSTLHCSLEHHPLQNTPDYIAISYRWGSPDDDRAIAVNGHFKFITKNLENALRQLVFHRKEYIWADALCINQDDIHERSLQVRRMRRIYERATEVAGFLGAADDDLIEVMEMIQRLSLLDPRALEQDNAFESIGRLRNSFRPALKTFLENPYWSRVWILQEVAINRHVRIYCGNHIVAWDDMALMLGISEKDKVLGDLGYHCLSRLLSLREDFQRDEAPISLVRAIRDSHRSLATEPRDKVYGLLGITSDSDKFISAPDYELPLKDIYLDMTTSWVRSNGSLDIICLQNVGKANTHSRDHPDFVPSWCPDWPSLGKNLLDDRWILYLSGQNSRMRLGKKRAVWDATPGTQGKLPANLFRDDAFFSNCLRVEALHIGEVIGLSTPYGPTNSGIDQDAKRISSKRSRKIASKPRTKVEKATTAAIFTAIYETLTLYEDLRRDQITRRERLLSLSSKKTLDWLSETNRPLRNWLVANEQFRHRGKTLYEWADKMKPLGSFLFESKNAEAEFLFTDFLGYLSRTLVDGMRLVTTNTGYIGWAHPATSLEDGLYLLHGCTTPVVLRWIGPLQSYRVVGDAFVHSIMDGELWNRRADLRTYEIILQ